MAVNISSGTKLSTLGDPHVTISGLPAFSDTIVWPFGSGTTLAGNTGFSSEEDALLTGLNAQFGFNQQPHRFTMNWARRCFTDADAPDIVGDIVDFDIAEFRIRGRVVHADMTKSSKGRLLSTSIEDQRKDLNQVVLDTYGLFDTKDDIGTIPVIDVHHFHLNNGLDNDPKALRLLREHGATYRQIWEAVGDTGNLQASLPDPGFVSDRLGEDKTESYRWTFRTVPLLDSIVKVFTDISYDLYWSMSEARLKVVDRTKRISITPNSIPGVEFTKTVNENVPQLKQGVDEGERPTSVQIFGGRMEGVIGRGDGIDIATQGGVFPSSSSVSLDLTETYNFLPAWEGATVQYFGADGTLKDDIPTSEELSAALKGIEWWAQKKYNVTSLGDPQAIPSRINNQIIYPRTGEVFNNLSGSSASGVGLIPNRGTTEDSWVIEWYNRVRNFAQNNYTRTYFLDTNSPLYAELDRFDIMSEAWCGLENENSGGDFNTGYKIDGTYRWLAAFWNEDSNKLKAWAFVPGRPLWGIDGKGVASQFSEWNERGEEGVYVPIETKQWNRSTNRLEQDIALLPEKLDRGLIVRFPNIMWSGFIVDQDVSSLNIPNYLAGNFSAETTFDVTVDPLKKGVHFPSFDKGINIPVAVFERYGYQKPVQFSAQGGAVGAFTRAEVQQKDELVPWSFEPRGTKNTVDLLQEEGQGRALGRVVNRADVDFLEVTTVGLPGISFDNYADPAGCAQHGVTNLSVNKGATSYWQTRYSAKTHFPQPVKAKPIQEETLEDFRFALHRVNERFNRPPAPPRFIPPPIFDPTTDDGKEFLQFPLKERLEILVTITQIITVDLGLGVQDIAYAGEDPQGILWPAARRASLAGSLNPASKLAQNKNAFATDGFFQKGMTATYHYEELDNGEFVHFFTGGIAISNARVVTAIESPSLVEATFRMDVQVPEDSFIRTLPNSDPPETETLVLEQILIKGVRFTDNSNVDTTIKAGDLLLTSGLGNENGNMLKPIFNEDTQQYEIDVGLNAPSNQKDKIFLLTGARGGAGIQFASVDTKPDLTTGRGGKIQTISSIGGGTLFEDGKITGVSEGNPGTQHFVDFIGVEFNQVSLGDPAIVIQETESPPEDPAVAAETPTKIHLLTYINKPLFSSTDAVGTAT